MSRYLSFASVLVLLIFSCQKEKSFEQGKASKGSLQGNFGDCLAKKINGVYTATKSLADTNYIDVDVDVAQTGRYTIYTDTVNGYYFRATGTFSSTGSNTVHMKGFGAPGSAGTNDFTVFYDSSFCNVSITVLPNSGSSGGTAVYTLAGSGGNCMNFTPTGTYTQGVALTSSNKVTIDVNVTTAGTWNITTPAVAGFTFSGSGTFTTTGNQTITLTGAGTPNAPGAKTFTVATGTSLCSFGITVAAGTTPPPPPPNSGDYFPRTVGSHWTYMWDQDPTDTMRWYVISPTKTVGANVYNIFMQDDGSSVDTLGYFRKSGSDYFQWGDIGFEFDFDNPLYAEVNMLKDNQAANFSWNSSSFSGTSGGTAVAARKKYTIKQQNTTITSNGVQYPNTIAVQVEYQFQLQGIPTWVSLPDYAIFFYTKNYGVTKVELYSGTTLADIIELIDYRVF
jgi:hypothetical protein